MSQLSQQSLLQDVRTWSEKQCKDDYESVMPKILQKIMNTSSSESMELCSLVLEKFLCYTVIDELGQKIFNAVSLQLGKVFCETLTKLPTNHQNTMAPTLPSTIEMLKYLVEVLKCYNGFVLHLVSLVKSTVCVELLYISDFSNNTVDILQKSYMHCKNSEKDYGQLFRHVSGLLGIIFQKTFGMQKNFGFIITNIKLSPELITSVNTNTAVEKLCQGLLSICETTCTVDNTLLASTWTTMVKFMKEFKDVVQQKIFPNSYVIHLCDNILQCVQYSIQLHDQSHHLLNSGDEATKKALNQSLKFSKVLMSIFYEVMKIFDEMFTRELADTLLSFFHDFHVLFEAKNSPSCSEFVMMKFRCNVMEQLLHYERVIALIISHIPFVDSIHFFSNDSRQSPDYGWLHVWLSIGKELLRNKSAMTQWSLKSADRKVASVLLVCLIVESAAIAHKATQSHFDGGVTLYQANLVIVCALLAQMSPDSFSKAEEAMIDFLFSSTPMKSILAADVFTFLGKSSPSLAKRYQSLFSAIMGTMGNINKITVPLLTLISISNRIGVSTKYIAKNLSTCINSFPDWLVLIECNDFDCNDISCEKISKGILNVSEQTEVSVRNMHEFSDFIVQLRLSFNSPSIAKKEIPLLKSMLSSAINTVLCFEKCDNELADSVIFMGFLSHVLAILKNGMLFLDIDQKTKVLKYLQILLMKDVPLSIKLNIIDLFSQSKNVHLENLESNSAIFQRFFFDENWMVRHLSVTAFIILTQSTSQTALLEWCAKDAAISEIIEGYLALDTETADLYCVPLAKPDNMYDVQLEKCLSSWRDQQCKQSENLSLKRNRPACLGSNCFVRCVSQLRADIQKLKQVISQNSINRGNADAEGLQNLSLVKTELNELLLQFDL